MSAKKYLGDNKQLLSEWDNKKNSGLGMNPMTIPWKSDKKAWWICSACGYSWEAAVKNRSNGRGCPKCATYKRVQAANEVRINKRGSLATEAPDLAMQWHPTLNGEMTPNDVTIKSMKKVWWMCDNQHEWQAAINNRSANKGCPYCSGQKVWVGYNDLASQNVALANEWHPVKNGDLRPTDVTISSGKKIWWQCPEGHEWQASIYNRNKGMGCPYCSGRLAIKGKNDLLSTNPEIAAEWNYSKNGNVSPADVTVGSKKKVWWRCVKGHEWQAVIYSRKHSGCPICAGESRTSFPEQVIFFYMQQITPAINRYIFAKNAEVDVFLPAFNIGIEYDGAFFHNNEAAKIREMKKNDILSRAGIVLLRVKERTVSMFLAENNEENVINCNPYPSNDELKQVITQILDRINELCSTHFSIDIDIDRDRGEIYSQYVKSNKENSLQIQNPELVCQWHPHKNRKLTPLMVTPHSNKRVWWQCEKGHEWQAVISSRNNGNGCPFCGGFLPIINENDLATMYPQLALEWHLFKNGMLTPRDVLPHSNKKVWWQCEKGHEWQAVISNRINGNGCPYCANKIVWKGYNDLLSVHPNIAAEWHPSKNGIKTPEMFVSGSEQKVWWLCANCKHEWKAAINKRTSGRGCPECSKYNRGVAYSLAMLDKNGSLAEKYPSIAALWHPEKNGAVLPADVTSNTHKVFWWICKQGHEWDASVSSMTKNQGCPVCSGKRVVKGLNDLATKRPDLANEWNSARNDNLSPNDVTVASGKYVWWQCAKGHEYQAYVYNRSKGSGCPFCSGRMPIVGENDLQTKNPELADQWHPSKNYPLVPTEVTFSSGKKVWWICDKGHEWEATIDSRNRGSKCPFCRKKHSK